MLHASIFKHLRPSSLFFAAIVIIFVIAGLATPAAAARDLSQMTGEEIRVLARRLTDAGCYRGPIEDQASATLEAAKKSCPDQDPFLRIETGMHIARLWRIAADSQCRLLATASEDKTVRLWRMPQGWLIRTQRLPIGHGNAGKDFAVAVSPDGSLVAVGGFDAAGELGKGFGVYVFDSATGTQIRRLGEYRGVILHLAFSPDGRRLAVALGLKEGVRILDVASGFEIMADRDFDERSNGVTFGPDGSLYAVALDGYVRRYGPDLSRVAKVPTGRQRPYSVAVDPSGRRLAIGYEDSPTIDIFDARTLERIGVGETDGMANGNLASVTWSQDGSRIFAAGLFDVHVGNAWRYAVRSFTPDGRLAMRSVPVAGNTVHFLVPCGDSIAFGTGDPSFGLIGADGRVKILGFGHDVDMRGKRGDGFMTSGDGTKVRFGLGIGEAQPVLFDLRRASLVDSPRRPHDLNIPHVDGIGVSNWLNSTAPRLDGRPIAIERYEIARSLAGLPGRNGFILGADWSLRSFDSRGRLRWAKPVPGAVWGVNIARGGDLVLAAFEDGTIRWYRGQDGRELLAFFVDKTDRRWVAWTPSGYYMASPGGEDLIGWHVNRGFEQKPDFFPASRFRARFNRPDIVQLVLDTLDEEEAVRRANGVAHRRESALPVTAALPPVIAILSPGKRASFSGSSVTLTYSLRSPSSLPVDSVDILIDGSPTGARGPGLAQAGDKEQRETITIGLPPRDVDVGLVAKSGALVSEVARVHLTYAGAAPSAALAAQLKPNLYALLVGIANYQNAALHLDYSAKDAIDFAAALKKQAGGLYREVDVKVLTDKDATALNVKEGLLWLQREMTSHDLAIVFLAGHGVTDAKNEFWFLAYEGDPKRLLTTAVSRDDIVGVLHDLPGKKLIFLDACHSGAALNGPMRVRGATVDVNSAVNDFATAEGGLVAYAASTGREFSEENAAWQHGAFTKALIEAIGEGKADLLKTGTITTSLLDNYLARRVKELTDGEQHPVMNRPDAVPDFPLALVRSP